MVSFSSLNDGLQKSDEDAGHHEHEQQAGNKAVNTGGLGDGAAQQHGGSDLALGFGLTGDGFAGFADGVAFTNAGADACDKSDTGANGAACQNDCFSIVISSLKWFLGYVEPVSPLRRLPRYTSW